MVRSGGETRKSFAVLLYSQFPGESTTHHAGPHGEALRLVVMPRERRELWVSVFIMVSVGKSG